jgi:hypothetical protein
VTAAALSFHVSHVRVEVSSDVPEVIEALAAVWGCCARPLVPPAREARFAVQSRDAGYAVIDALGAERTTRVRADVLPLLEMAIYAALPGWHAQHVLLHGACVRWGEATALLLGRSGAGKSSLAACALRHGFEYFSDELTVTDGARLWGVPRALQFEPIAAGRAPAPWVRDADLARYPLRLSDGRDGAVPLWFPSPARVPAAPSPVGEAFVFAIARGDREALAPLDPVPALAALHEAAFQPPVLDIGKLVHAGRCAELTWHDPERAVELLARALERARSL